MNRRVTTVDQVREAQEYFKTGDNHHKGKKFHEAIESFNKVVEINPFEEGHLKELQQKLKSGSYKLQQESMAYMGCAAVHLSSLIQELDDEQKEQVPVDEELSEVFKDWE